MTLQSLDLVEFQRRFVDRLPGDAESANHRRQVRGAAYSRVLPTPVSAPRLLAWSDDLAGTLGLPLIPDDSVASVLSGNRLLPGMDPFAMCYGGHQFGNWAGQLGDGRAINLGEMRGPDGRWWMWQLKGAGPTPYSRTADGLAVLRSSVREYLCSEAMHALGVPTTRALSLVGTGELVIRDMFYDGNPRQEPGAVVCRVAPSFLRFGNFQLPAARRDLDLLRRLVDYCMQADFGISSQPNEASREAWFREICERTADLLVHWMRVGFVHGVMNTDNMSVLGLTIDYGPYGWVENFDPDWTPNTTDAAGRRYAFGQQPQIALWNLVQFANALVPLFSDTKPLQACIDAYTERFNAASREMMACKIGIEGAGDAAVAELADELPQLLQLAETDMTIFYRRLAAVSLSPSGAELSAEDWQQVLLSLEDAWYQPEAVGNEARAGLQNWLRHYRAILGERRITDGERRLLMDRTNPKFVLRNYLAQLAIDRAEQGDASLILELQQLLKFPYDEQPGKEHFAAKRPDWARQRAGCSMLSCSS
jgi:uncharacterized protein YdiU (UPF0061 family)